MTRAAQRRVPTLPRKASPATIVAGVMSGTSADGIDVALVSIRDAAGAEAGQPPKLKLLAHHSIPYTSDTRAAVLRAMNASSISVAELARLHWRLGEFYAQAIEQACRTAGRKASLIGVHGQTIYHQAAASDFLGGPVRATWQMGEAALIAERLQVPVVSDFRPADLAAGGQGAPLVPMLDFSVFRSATKNRVLLNLGGIANVTVIPAGGSLNDLLAFDTGPANMVIDAQMENLYGRHLDAGGQIAARGRSIKEVIVQALASPWFSEAPPKSCGREQFGQDFARAFHAQCQSRKATKADVIATATELTAASILDAYSRFCWSHLGQRAPLARATEMIVAGGGARNTNLVRRLSEGFAGLGVKVLLADALGMPAEAKEAAAFALLAWLRTQGRPGNVPSATGATHAALLGKVSRAS